MAQSNMSDYLSKRMSQGMEQDPGSPDILQELIDVSTKQIWLILLIN